MIEHAIVVLILPAASTELHTGTLDADPGAVMAVVVIVAIGGTVATPHSPGVVSSMAAIMTTVIIIVVIMMVPATMNPAGGAISLVIRHAGACPVARVGVGAGRVH